MAHLLFQLYIGNLASTRLEFLQEWMFFVGADLRSQAQYQAECYLPLSNGHHKVDNNKTFVENFDLMKLHGQPEPLA